MKNDFQSYKRPSISSRSPNGTVIFHGRPNVRPSLTFISQVYASNVYRSSSTTSAKPVIPRVGRKRSYYMHGASQLLHVKVKQSWLTSLMNHYYHITHLPLSLVSSQNDYRALSTKHPSWICTAQYLQPKIDIVVLIQSKQRPSGIDDIVNFKGCVYLRGSVG
jgi:hypothetical protein